MAAYCTKEDLLTGDVPLAGKYGDGTSFVQLAADEIDAQIGHLYVTPVDIKVPPDPEGLPENRPSLLLLKKINTLLASGRIVLDMAAGTEDDRLHAYGKSMHDEAIALLNMITNRQIILQGAELLSTLGDDANTAVSIVQADPYSLVEGFYARYNQDHILPVFPPYSPMRPYDTELGAG